MTCSSCATRIEKRLNRMPGVEASVNYTTEKAKGSLPEGTTVEDAVARVAANRLHPPPARTGPDRCRRRR